MRRIAVINQKGGVGKTTTCANLGAALVHLGRRVLLVDMDPQANLSMHLGVEAAAGEPSTYRVLIGRCTLGEALRGTSTEGLSLVPSHIDLSGAELELASTIGRESLLRLALERWIADERAARGERPVDYILFDCPPSLGLLSINALAAASEVLITLQTEFFALQGMSKLVEVVQLLQQRLNPQLEIAGILPCLYDSRLKLAREVLAEIREYFPKLVYASPIRTNVKLAEAPSFGRTIFQYACDSNGALDHLRVARELLEQEPEDGELGRLARPPEGTQAILRRIEATNARLAELSRPVEAEREAPPELDGQAGASPDEPASAGESPAPETTEEAEEPPANHRDGGAAQEPAPEGGGTARDDELAEVVLRPSPRPTDARSRPADEALPPIHRARPGGEGEASDDRRHLRFPQAPRGSAQGAMDDPLDLAEPLPLADLRIPPAAGGPFAVPHAEALTGADERLVPRDLEAPGGPWAEDEVAYEPPARALAAPQPGWGAWRRSRSAGSEKPPAPLGDPSGGWEALCSGSLAGRLDAGSEGFLDLCLAALRSLWRA